MVLDHSELFVISMDKPETLAIYSMLANATTSVLQSAPFNLTSDEIARIHELKNLIQPNL